MNDMLLDEIVLGMDGDDSLGVIDDDDAVIPAVDGDDADADTDIDSTDEADENGDDDEEEGDGEGDDDFGSAE